MPEDNNENVIKFPNHKEDLESKVGIVQDKDSIMISTALHKVKRELWFEHLFYYLVLFSTIIFIILLYTFSEGAA